MDIVQKYGHHTSLKCGRRIKQSDWHPLPIECT